MKKPQSYKDLEIYQLSHRLAVEIHKMTLNLPKHEMYEEASQIRKSAKSIPANVVEGFGRRRYKAELFKFLVYAHASCDETQEHLRLLFETNAIEKDTYGYFTNEYEKLGRKLYRFLKAVENGHLI